MRTSATSVLADTGPLLAAANARDDAHALARAIVRCAGRDLLVPDAVLVETDHLLRQRLGAHAARAFLRAASDGAFTVVHSTPGLLRRAVELDAAFADLGLGLTDALVMAYAERHDLPILTFDFRDFRATRPAQGVWRLVVDEDRYRDSVGRRS